MWKIVLKQCIHKLLTSIREYVKYTKHIGPDLLFPAGPDLLFVSSQAWSSFHIGAGITLQGLITQVYVAYSLPYVNILYLHCFKTIFIYAPSLLVLYPPTICLSLFAYLDTNPAWTCFRRSGGTTFLASAPHFDTSVCTCGFIVPTDCAVSTIFQNIP